jgi:tRNA pseudouridine38-40 synthase
MHNIKLTVAYDGTDYHGWQIQPEMRTIQGALAAVLGNIAQEQIAIHGAGRTDAGVHAWGQVASFRTNSELAPKEWSRALNALLPPTIRIRDAQEAASDFHARWMATAKTYRYRIYRGPILPPFDWRYVLHDPHRLDFAAMAEAARQFEGRHDFTTFAASTGVEEEDRDRLTERVVMSSELTRLETKPAQDEPEEWVYTVRGKSFLRNMVRKIVGTLLDVGRGRLAPSDIPGLLAQRDRTRSGPTAPPQGLCLMSVEYPDAPASLATQVE